MLKADNEMTTPNILNKLCEQGITTTKSPVSRAIKRMGWIAKTTRYCQLIRLANKHKRFDFCHHLLSTNETFQDIIFTDEAMVQLKPAHRKITTRPGKQGGSDQSPSILSKCLCGGDFNPRSN